MSDLQSEYGVVREFSEDDFIEYICTSDDAEIKTVVLLGRVRSGKTTMLLKITDRLRALGVRVGGICQPEENGVYFARDIETAESRWIARRENDSVFFNPETFDWSAQKIVLARKCCDVLAVDEIGRLESMGQGHLSAVLHPVRNETIRLRLLSVREDVFKDVRCLLPPVLGLLRV